MILIVGGAYQGKEIFAKEQFLEIIWTDGKDCDMEEVFSAQGILNFHEYIRRAMKEKRDISNLAEMLMEKNQVIVADEIGYGIVPMDAFDREYREMTGRICTKLASNASKVYRVICGIGTVIKG